MILPLLRSAAVARDGLPAWRARSLRTTVLACAALALARPGIAQVAATPDPTVSELKKLSVEELMDIEVTSVSKQPEKLLDAASAIQVITNEDILRSGASSIPEALRLADNLDVARQNSHDWNISARGFNTDLANKLLVLVDGRTVYTPLFSGVFWDVQDYLLADLDRIEVISGPGGTLWGANAVNGVINITTKNAKDTQGGLIETGGGTDLQGFAAARYGGKLAPDVYFRVYAKYFDRANEGTARGKDATDGWNMSRGGFRIDSTASPQNPLTLQGDLYSGDEDVTTGGTGRVSGGNLLGRWTHTLAPDSDLSLQLYYDRTHLASPKPSNGFVPAGTLTDDLDTYDLDFQYRFPVGRSHRLIWGLGYRFTRDDVGNAPSLVFLPARLDQRLFSGFVQDEIALAPSLTLTLGSKLEHNDYTGVEVEPGTRLQWNFADRRMLWAAVSRAVRTPSRIDRDLQEPTGLPAPFPSSILNGGPDFRSETVVAYELGYRAELGAKLSGSLSFFFNDYDHVRSTTPAPLTATSFGFPLVFQNNLEGETHGAELSFTYQMREGWRLHGGYTLLREHLHVKPGQVDFSHGLNETADPGQQFSLRSSVDLPRNVELDSGLRWVDTLHNNNGPNPGTVPGYFELDVRLGWHPTRSLELSLVGQNLLHDHHPEYGFPGPAREEIQRSVYGKATWRF